MLKPEKTVSDPATIDDILQRGTICHLAMVDGGRPYVVPLCYGYRDGVLFAHSAREGRKLDLLRRNSAVCFDVAVDTELAPGQGPCRGISRNSSGAAPRTRRLSNSARAVCGGRWWRGM